MVIMLHICFQDDEMADRTQPISEPSAPPKKETAWERGLKLAREVSTITINSLRRRAGVFCFQRSTVGVFVLPFMVLKWQNRTGDNVLCFTIGTSYGWKKLQATPTKQELGSSRFLFKIYSRHPCPFYEGVLPQRLIIKHDFFSFLGILSII